MRITKKAAAAGLSVLMIGSVFMSCNGGSGSAKLSEENKKLAAEYKKEGYQTRKFNGKAAEFDGMKIMVADWWSSPEGNQSNPAASPMDEDLKKFRSYIKDAYNVDIDEYGISSWGAHPENVANFCTTGGDENYVFVIDGRSAAPGLKANLFYDLSKIKSVDWSNKKWSPATRDLMSKGSSFYGMRALSSEARVGVFFNKRLLREANIDPDTIYDMQANGTWTWETFEEMLKATTRDLDNDGVIDTWGMGNLNGEMCTAAVFSNGSCWIDKDANGKYFSRIGDEKTIEAMDWVQKMVKNYEKPAPEGANWDWFYAAFINGEIAFQVDQQYRVGNISDMQDDWGFVCFPMGPNSVGHYTNLAQDNIYVIPAVYDDARAEKIAQAFDVFTDPIPGYENDTSSWKEDYYSRFRDERAVDETMQLMRDNPVAMFHPMIAGLDLGPLFIWNAYPGNITMQEGYESSKNAVQALLDEANK